MPAVPDTRLTRIATGSSRWWLFAAGAIVAVGGLLLGNHRPSRAEPPAVGNQRATSDEAG